MSRYYCECGFSCKKYNYILNHRNHCIFIKKENENKKNIKSNILDKIIKFYQENKIYPNNIIEGLNGWWTKYSDRKFMLELYPKIGNYLKNMLNPFILDIGFENFNLINKDLLDNKNINYFQLEPFINDKMYNSDKVFNCYVEDFSNKHSEYKKNFNIILDFGVLGAPSVSKDWDENKLEKYINNILYGLKDNGIYILKIDRPYYDMKEYKLDFEKFINPYFEPINFLGYDSGIKICRKNTRRRPQFAARDQYDFFFLKKRKQINNLVVVAHMDDESIWCEEKLDEKTHVIVVFGLCKKGLDNSKIREKEFINAMNITKCSYEIWNFLDKKYRMDNSIINNISGKIKKVLDYYKDIKTIYTHNIYGEYSHMDHIRLNKIMTNTLNDYYKNKNFIPKVYQFWPHLNYKNDDKLDNIVYVEENERHTKLLDQYKSQTVDIFRNIRFDFKCLVLDNLNYCNDCEIKFKKLYSYKSHLKYHDDQEHFLKKFNKESFDNIEFINGIPKVVYVCWFGGYTKKRPLMSFNRFEAFKSLVKNISIPVILLTEKNIYNFEKKEHKFNKGFLYLSGVQKSDYIRVYMLHHYGGGYHDIKWRKESWNDEWIKNNWIEDDNIWIYGRRESNENAIAYPPGKQYIQKEYNKLVTMGWIICKKNTKFTSELLNQIENILDNKYEKLKKNPGYKSSGYYPDKPFDLVKENCYPLRWLEILGEVFHPLMLKYNNHIKYGLKDAIKKKGYK
jgi:LmbE family N-acetylglucosaminyl deacetylase